MYRVQRSPNKNVIKSPWAVKRITKRAIANGNTAVYNDRLVKEAKILRSLSHANVIGFRGMTKDVAGRDVLAIEICTAALSDIIELRAEEDEGPIPSKNALRVILDVATALDYLHTTALILHGDIKAPNVLVNGNFIICKLCDFGVSLPLTRKGVVDVKADPHASYVGTELWAGPEVFDNEEGDASNITTKTDIFSFGCTIYEMLTLTAPHLLMTDDLEDKDDTPNKNNDKNARALSFDDDTDEDSSMNCTQEDDFNQLMETRMGTRPLLPDDIEFTADYDRVLEMFVLCTNELPEQRPSARMIIDELDEGKKEKK